MASSRNCRLEIPSFRVARSMSLRVACSRRVEKIFCIRKHYIVSDSFFCLPSFTCTPDPPIEIVGVAADAVYRSLREPMLPTMYFPLAQHDHEQAFFLPLASTSLSVRSGPDSPVLLTRSVATAINAVNPQLALTFRPLADQVNASLTQERVVATVSGFFGSLALLLAALGLYGVTSFAVARRRTEIGIRMALGAAPAGIVRLVLSRVSRLVGLGVLVGAGISVWASQFVATLLSNRATQSRLLAPPWCWPP